MVITEQVLDEQIASYKVQLDQLQTALVKLEQDYAGHKDVLRDTMNQVSGAMQGLQVLKTTLAEPVELPVFEQLLSESLSRATTVLPLTAEDVQSPLNDDIPF